MNSDPGLQNRPSMYIIMIMRRRGRGGEREEEGGRREEEGGSKLHCIECIGLSVKCVCEGEFVRDGMR